MRELKRKQTLDDLLFWQIKVCGLPLPVREFRFHHTRKWRFDLAWAWPGVTWLAVECEGGSWVNGAHSRGTHFESDCEKYAEAMLLGWRVLRVTGNQIKSGKAIEWITKLLGVDDDRRANRDVRGAEDRGA